MIIDPIILSGPSATHREIEYAAEAAGVGWNMRNAHYIRLFRREVAARTRQKSSLALCSSHAALHVTLMSLGIGPGSEVLVPEIADISVASAVVHAGAVPVFCDVDARSLCLSPESAAARVTPKTRAVIPVHLYGQMCDMAPLLHLAEQNKLAVIEHATQGMGASYRGHPAGEFGLVSIVGFEDSNPLVAGGGAVLLTSREEIMARAEKLALQVGSKENPMFYEALHFGYAMSNMQASVGYAQMQRFDELMEQKKRIFSWYKERLDGVPGIRLNPDIPGSVNSCWMTALFLDDPSLERSALMEALFAGKIMCAPVYYPLSYMPMFTRADNPVAYTTGTRAMLLPCGHNRTEEEVEYICASLKQLLADRRLKKAVVQPTGWLKRKSDTLERLAEIKRQGLSLPFEVDGEKYSLHAVTTTHSKNPRLIAFLTELRAKNMQALLSGMPVTEESVREIMEHYDGQARDFLLFIILQGKTMWGHIAVDGFDCKAMTCKVDAAMMRDDAPRGIAPKASLTVQAWAGEALGMKKAYAHILGSNKPSRLSTSAIGFKDVNLVQLRRQEEPGGWTYRPMYIMGTDKPDDTFVLCVRDLGKG